ncbi:hypothetical protein JCM31826_10840 [Thermaurantimonas aggregans]|uniref:DUF4476 domain-containing protein n=1 Tax=Thermaurantimonas aggregans TaxID=2173829 RepID=A0A401XKS4_9FLAO|nr:DUF4476 domain-containing protein [Thermaurantimonas aggregans]MCX8147940.1 DUF4476 domain-containing protein [Thermaurantimonas aggregans]GCD77602.1 hypothetical protein JCM31826_10840 [Thermaurantimonas aggregans]
MLDKSMRLSFSLIAVGMLFASQLFCQHIVVTSPDKVEFSFGIDSFFYARKWTTASATPVKKDQTTFFVLLKKDSVLLQKKIPSTPDNHHFVIEKGKSGEYTLYYRGILNTLPDSIEISKEKTNVHLSSVLTNRPALAAQTSPPSPSQNSESSQPQKADTAQRQTTEISPQNLHSKPDTSALDNLPAADEPQPFDKTVEAVKKAEFEFERMMLIREYVEKRKTNTQELKVLARLLTYDLTRLQLLRDCYPNTLDRINYRELTSVFDFEISKQSLLEFINEHEK